MSSIRRFASLATIAALGLHCAPAFSFTAEQADAGRAVFEQTCATCHGANLRQLPNALLGGPEFVARWGNRGTNELIAETRSTMPPDNPGGLGAEAYTNIVAYLLQANGSPASEAPITAASRSASARIFRVPRPFSPLPNPKGPRVSWWPARCLSSSRSPTTRYGTRILPTG